MITYSKNSAVRDTMDARLYEGMALDIKKEHDWLVNKSPSFEALLSHHMHRISVMLVEAARNGCDALIYDMPEDTRICTLIEEELWEAGYVVHKTSLLQHPELIEIRWDE